MMDDLISRKAVLDAICGVCAVPYMRNISPEECRKEVNCAFMKAIEELKAVEAIPTAFPLKVTMEQVEAMRNTTFPKNANKLTPLIYCAPVRHGSWRRYGYGNTFDCSICGFTFTISGAEKMHPTNINYCPNCGARMMDEEEQEK